MARSLDDLLPRADQGRVVAAIQDAESRTSAQIKVHVEERCGGDPMARAQALFGKLGLAETRGRNAVLLYIAPGDRRYALLGDEAIHVRGGDALWQRAAKAMRAAFVRGALGDGLVAAITEIGALLSREFPGEGAGPNEIPDDISTDSGEPST